MPKVWVHPSAKADIKLIRESTPKEAAKIAVFLAERLSKIPVMCLRQHNYTDGILNVKDYAALQEEGYNIWRIRLMGLDVDSSRQEETTKKPEPIRLNHRILYAINQSQDTVFVLAVVARSEFNYEPDHTITKRCRRDFVGVGLRRRRSSSA